MNYFLFAGGMLSIIASLLHVGIIIKGASWYRFFGAGEDLARMAENGSHYPAMITSGIAAVLFVWSLYAFSGAGLIMALPLLKPALIIITTVYMLRGLALLPLFIFSRDKLTPFLIWSSVICVIYGLCHAIGLQQIWPHL